MAAQFEFKILTPGDEAVVADVESIVAPGEGGYLGILAHHAPIITTLKAGSLKVRDASGQARSYTISGGILKVAHNRAVLLTESLVGADEKP